MLDEIDCLKRTVTLHSGRELRCEGYLAIEPGKLNQKMAIFGMAMQTHQQGGHKDSVFEHEHLNFLEFHGAGYDSYPDIPWQPQGNPEKGLDTRYTITIASIDFIFPEHSFFFFSQPNLLHQLNHESLIVDQAEDPRYTGIIIGKAPLYVNPPVAGQRGHHVRVTITQS